MMTDQENYRFDVFGFLIVKNVLSQEEIQACCDALETQDLDEDDLPESLAQLRDHSVLMKYLDDLIVEESQLVRGPWIAGSCETDHEWIGGNEPRMPSRMYHHQNDVRFCQGVLAIWALSDLTAGDGVGFVPASHKSYVEMPDDVGDLGVMESLTLDAGDLVICAETVLHRLAPAQARLLVFNYASDKARRLPSDEEVEDWVQELTPVQRAVVAPGGTADIAPVVFSDGDKVELKENDPIFHPTIYKRNTGKDIDHKEFYHWDLCGHLVLKKVMDDQWLNAANEAIDACAGRIRVGGSAAKESPVLAGTGVPSLHKLFELPKPHCDPFREMIAHPAVIQRLNWMMGSGFRCRSVRAICSVKGTSGHGLHSFAEPARPVNTYVMQNGRAYCDSINVAWQLRDVCEADGGFMCIPGSHKAKYPSWPKLITCEEDMDMVRHVSVEAGDVVMFLGAAQAHGAYPWESDVDRRNILLGYSSRNIG